MSKRHEEAVKAFIERCKVIAQEKDQLDEKAGICIEAARQAYQVLRDYEEEASAVAGAAVISYGAALEKAREGFPHITPNIHQFKEAEKTRLCANQANKRFLQARLFKLLAQSTYFALRAYEENDTSLAQIADEATAEAEKAEEAYTNQRITEKDATRAYENAAETWKTSQAEKN